MSNMIPFVSSSPPPFDDSFGWDDGDDDFGNFTGADDHHEDSPDLHIANLSSNKTQNIELVNQNVAGSTQKIAHTANDNSIDESEHRQSTFEPNLNVDSNKLSCAETKNAANFSNGDSEFADFAQFDGEDMEVSTPVRPHIAGLLLEKTDVLRESTETQYMDNDSDLQFSSESETLQESKEHNKTGNMSMRDSTTDSGMFSNDISPVPKSEDTAEFCDKTSSSDCDEPFPDLPSDGRVELTSDQVQHSDNQMASEHLEVDVVSTSFKDTKVENDEVDDNSRTNSLEPVSKYSVSGCYKKVEIEDEIYENGKSVSSANVEDLHIHQDEHEIDEWGHFSDNESGYPHTSSVDSERKLDNGSDSVVIDSNKLSVENTDNKNEIVSDVEHTVENISSESEPVPNSEDVGDSLSDLDNSDESTSSESKPVDNSENVVEILSDISHTDENISSESKPVPNSEDMGEHVCDNSQHSIRTDESKDHKDSTELQAIPSNTDLSKDTFTVDNDLESPNDSCSKSHKSFVTDSSVSPDISAESIDPVSSSNQDTDVSVTSSNSTVDSNDFSKEQSTNPDVQQNSEDEMFSEKASLHTCDTGLEVEDNSFGNFAKFDVAPDTDNCDDNWASFQSTDNSGNTFDQPLDLPCISQEDDGDDDDFGDFIDNVVVKNDDVDNSKQFGDSTGFASESNTAKIETFSGKGDGECSDEEWANFGEPQDDDEFGGFGQFESKTIPEPKILTKTFKLKDMREKVPGILSISFPTVVLEDGDEMNCKKPEILDITISCDVETRVTLQSEKPTVVNFSKKIWGQLVDLDKTPALVYTWNSSSGTAYMFKTLRIDTQNILLGHKKQSVPIFASNMGLLEPIRGPVDTKKESTKTEPTLVDPSKVDIPLNENPDIPPVEFDWHNSGLTNPLAAKTLDLDFLTEQESECAGKGSVFQSEMLDTPRSSVKSLPPLEDVLKNMKLTTTAKRKKEENLNPEARRIIDSLPILSFMQAKVLMFPFRQQDQ